MSRTQVSQLNLSQITPSKQSDHECIVSILRKPEKTKEEAKGLFDKIKNLPFFQHFFAHYIKDMDMHSILSLCQTFEYEKYDPNSVIIQQREPSNDKFYVILSGEVGVIIKNDMLGQFGDINPNKKAKENPNLDKNSSPGNLSARHRRSKHLTILVPSSSMSESLNKSRLNRPRTASITPQDQALARRNSLSKNYQKSIFGRNAGPFDTDGDLAPEHMDMMGKGPSDGRSKIASLFKKAGKAAAATSALGELVKTMKTGSKELRPPSISISRATSCQSIDVEDEGEGELTPRTPRTPRLKTEEIEEEEEDEEKHQFEKVSLNYGRIIRYLKEGEGFGEIALKRSIPRTATILCKTECEVLVMQKEQYELGFSRMQWEKEEFLNSVFTLLKTSIASSQNYNYLIYSFRTERYPKGTYLLQEGKTNEKEPKFYVVQHGECAVEKQILKEITDPYDLHKTLVSAYEKVQITVAGRGVIVGEEILFTEDEYDYSVKAISEVVIVQAITKKEYAQRFPKEFQDYVKGRYEKKKHHRELVFEQVSKDQSMKMVQYKTDNVYCLKNTEIKDYVMKPSLQGFSRYLNRGNKMLDDKETMSAELHAPGTHRKLNSTLETNPVASSEELHTYTHTQASVKTSARNYEEVDREKEERELMTRFGAENPKQNNKIMARIHFLNNMPKKALKHFEEKMFDVSDISSVTLVKNKSQGSPVSRPFSARIGGTTSSISKGRQSLKNIINPVNPADIIMSQNNLKNKEPNPPKNDKVPQSPRSARLQSEKKFRKMSEGIFKDTSKGFLSSSPSLAMLNSPSVSRPTSARSVKESPTQNKPAVARPATGRPSTRNSLKKSLFIAGIATEPMTRYKLDIGSLNFLPMKSPQNAKGEQELNETPSQNQSHCLLSITSLAFVPPAERMMSSPNHKKQSSLFMEWNKRNELDIQLPLPTNPNITSPKTMGSRKKSTGDMRLMEAYQWRKKVFQKPGRKASAGSIAASYNGTPRGK